MPFWRGVRYVFETAFAYIIFCFFWILPLHAASAVGGFLGRNIGPRLGISRKAYNNISLAFPDKSEAEKQKIILDMWDNLGRTIAEYPHLKKIGQIAEVVNKDLLLDISEKKHASIVFSGHIANWEVLPTTSKQQGNFESHLAYRKPNNPWVDHLLRTARSCGAVGHIPKSRKGALEMTRLMKNKGILGILIDQKYNEGISVPFLGHDAMTMPFVAQLGLKYDCAVYPGRIERIKGPKFRFTIYPAMTFEKTGDNEKDIYNAMVDIHRHLEGWITERPGEWLWLHQRWPKPSQTEDTV